MTDEAPVADPTAPLALPPPEPPTAPETPPQAVLDPERAAADADARVRLANVRRAEGWVDSSYPPEAVEMEDRTQEAGYHPDKTRVVLASPVHLTLDDGQVVHIGRGVNYLAPEHANHWYVQAHLTDPPAPLHLQPGTPAFEAARRRELANEALLRAASEQQVLDATNAARAKTTRK